MPACFSSYPTLPLSVKHYYCCIQSLYFLSGLLTCGNPYLKKTQTYYSIITREQPYIFLNLHRTLVLEAKKRQCTSSGDTETEPWRCIEDIYYMPERNKKHCKESRGLKGLILKEKKKGGGEV